MKTIACLLCLVPAFCFGQLAQKASLEKSSDYELKSLSRHYGSHLRYDDGTSANWAGYATETNLSAPTIGAVTMVKGSWIVPSVATTTGGPAYSAVWVGIDGYVDAELIAELSGYSKAKQRQLLAMIQTVEQIGTGQDYTARGPQYYAWVEFYPQGALEISRFPVRPGDKMTASVVYLGNDLFQVNLSNDTQQKTFSAKNRFSADRYSGEWIVEAPASTNGQVLALADFGTVNLSGCSATLSGTTNPIAAASTQYEGLDMGSSTTAKAMTSALNSSGDGFSVVWQNR